MTLWQRDHCPESGHGMPCPDISIATAVWHAVPRHLHRYCGVACRAPTAPLRRGITAIRYRSDHEAIPSCRIRVHRRTAALASRAGAPTARHRVAWLVSMTILRGAALGTSVRSKPRRGFLSNVEFLGEVSDVLHSRAPLPLIPPAPFSHKGRRGSLGVLMPETVDGTQGLAEKSTPVRQRLPRPQGGLMVFEEIIRHSPRRRALHSIAEGLWSLSNYSAIARAGGLRLG